MKKFQALGAYLFAGGFTRGILDTERFDVLAHLEESMYGVKTAKLNFDGLFPIYVGLDTWESFEPKKPLDLIYGNPPCAAWSVLNGKKTRTDATWVKDPRVDCTRHHFNLLKRFKPKVWVWESVDRAFQIGTPFVRELSLEAVELGYSVTHLRFDGQFVGGKHRRVRYFMVAHRIEFEDWRTVKLVDAPVVGKVLTTVKNKIGDDGVHQPLPKSLVAAWKKAKPGQPLQAVWDELNPIDKRAIRVSSTGRSFITGRPGFSKVKLNPALVAPTIVGNNAVHPTEPRFLTLAEQKAFCGYPREWRTENEGSASMARWDLFTRAVMPPIGRWIGDLVAEDLERHKKVKTPRVTVVDLRKKNSPHWYRWDIQSGEFSHAEAI